MFAFLPPLRCARPGHRRLLEESGDHALSRRIYKLLFSFTPVEYEFIKSTRVWLREELTLANRPPERVLLYQFFIARVFQPGMNMLELVDKYKGLSEEELGYLHAEMHPHTQAIEQTLKNWIEENPRLEKEFQTQRELRKEEARRRSQLRRRI